MHNSKNKAFTLVELIVVIVILAILATIAFLSFSSQSASARDSTRLSDMSNIVKGLSVFNATSGNYPLPDNPITISASGITIGKQGYAGSSVLNMIKISNGGKDPLDISSYYTYATNLKQNKFQLLGFLENKNSIVFDYNFKSLLESKKIFASTTVNRFPYYKGDIIGIILSATGSSSNIIYTPQQDTGTGVDLTTTNTSIVAIISNTKTPTSIISNMSNNELVNNYLTSPGQTCQIGDIFDLNTNKCIPDLNTVLLMHFDGNLNDSSSNNNTGSNTNIGFTQVKDGFSKSGDFGGGANYVILPKISQYVMNSTNQFTIDLWVYFKSLTNNVRLFSLGNPGSGAGTAGNRSFVNSNGKIHYDGGAYPTNYRGFDTTNSLAINKWYHIAFVKNGQDMKIYVNGVEWTGILASSPDWNFNTPNYDAPGCSLLVGGFNGACDTNPAGEYLNGYMDEFRISKGVARWTSEFIPPTAPY